MVVAGLITRRQRAAELRLLLAPFAPMLSMVRQLHATRRKTAFTTFYESLCEKSFFMSRLWNYLFDSCHVGCQWNAYMRLWRFCGGDWRSARMKVSWPSPTNFPSPLLGRDGVKVAGKRENRDTRSKGYLNRWSNIPHQRAGAIVFSIHHINCFMSKKKHRKSAKEFYGKRQNEGNKMIAMSGVLCLRY